MHKFQPKKYIDIADLISDLPPVEEKITLSLLAIIRNNLLYQEEKLAYNVPYFYGNQRICFVWPGSIPWGKTKPKTVTLGFCNGAQFNPLLKSNLIFENRKTVGVINFQPDTLIDEEIIKSLLIEAQYIDDLAKRTIK